MATVAVGALALALSGGMFALVRLSPWDDNSGFLIAAVMLLAAGIGAMLAALASAFLTDRWQLDRHDDDLS